MLTYWSQGQWKEAEELQVLVMETRQALGEEHPDTLTSMGDLGQWKDAEDLQVLVIETRRRVLGEEHPLSLMAMGDLVSTYQSQGQWKSKRKWR